MPRPALLCALLAGALAATAVAGQRVGLALTVALALVAAAAVSGAARRPARVPLALASALALQPVLRDAGWVVATSVAAALVGVAAAVVPTPSWRAAGAVVIAPVRLLAGNVLVARVLAATVPAPPRRQARALARGAGLAALLLGCFGALFVTADTAFAELAGDVIAVEVGAFDAIWRPAVALAFCGAAGALVRAARRAAPPAARGRAPERIELLMGLGALVTLFAAFVAVQLRVLFGGAAYVQQTTGLGYGDYARQGFVALLVAALLTLAVVAVAARRRDRAVRVLLGTLCVLTLVVLVSAHHRLMLVENAYGLTRVRYGGHAVVFWLAGVFALVLAAGASRAVAAMAPRAAVLLTLGGALAFSLSNPDARIAEAAVAHGGRLDACYLSGLSADALPALERLPPGRARTEALHPIRSRLERPDGIAGFNLARADAR